MKIKIKELTPKQNRINILKLVKEFILLIAGFYITTLAVIKIMVWLFS
jgi:hypothetical protein|tara:strand:- start:6608 stop:6751 length:144 start_codon:yes stop_codon:yes gene_type:complete